MKEKSWFYLSEHPAAEMKKTAGGEFYRYFVRLTECEDRDL